MSYSRMLRTLCIASCVGLWGLAAYGQQGLEKKKHYVVEVDHILPGQSLEALWQDCDTVVVGRVIGGEISARRNRAVPDTAEPLITFRVNISEVMKSYSGVDLGRIIQVWQIAGAVEDDRAVYTVSETAGMPLRLGAVYVLFLKKAEGENFDLAYGPSGVYLLSEGRAITQGRSFVRSGSENELLSDLRGLSRKARSEKRN
jgi:hypothetical protein